MRRGSQVDPGETGEFSWVVRYLRVNLAIAALIVVAHGVPLVAADPSKGVAGILSMTTGAAVFVLVTGIRALKRGEEPTRMRVVRWHARVFVGFVAALICWAVAVVGNGPLAMPGRVRWTPGVLTAFIVYTVHLLRLSSAETQSTANRSRFEWIAAFFGALLDVSVAWRLLAK